MFLCACLSLSLSLSLNKHTFWFTNPSASLFMIYIKVILFVYGVLTTINSKDESYAQNEKFFSHQMLRQLVNIGDISFAADGMTLTWATDFVVYRSWLCLCSSDVQIYFQLRNTNNNHLHFAVRLHEESFGLIGVHLFMNVPLTNFQGLCISMSSNENSGWTNNFRLFQTVFLFPDIFSVWTNRSQRLDTHINLKICFNMMTFYVVCWGVHQQYYTKLWFLDITDK